MNPPQVYMCSPSRTLLPPPSPYHPSGPSQCISPKHPASCIEPGLATRFLHDILHVSFPFSQISPPSPSPTESIRLFYTSCIQISQEAGQVVWYSHLFQNFSQFVVVHTIKGFGIVNKAEIDVFLEFSCFFYDPMNVGNLISGSSAFSKPILNIWKFTVHVLLKPGLENFEHFSAGM